MRLVGTMTGASFNCAIKPQILQIKWIKQVKSTNRKKRSKNEDVKIAKDSIFGHICQVFQMPAIQNGKKLGYVSQLK